MFANSLQRNFTGRPQERHILPAALPALRLFDSKSILALLVPLAALVGANDYSLVLPSNTVPESLVPQNDFSGPGRFLGKPLFPRWRRTSSRLVADHRRPATVVAKGGQFKCILCSSFVCSQIEGRIGWFDLIRHPHISCGSSREQGV